MDSNARSAERRAPQGGVDKEAEAARSALLRRIAPGLRHQMVAHLQPVEMLVELTKRRLANDQLNPAQLHESIEKIGQHARAAMGECIGAVTWLSLDDDREVPLDQGVAECVAVLRSGLGFRGFSLHDATQDAVQARVSRGAVRSLLATALLALSDTLPAPLELRITVRTEGDFGLLQVHALPSLAAGTFFGECPARALDLDDLRALARDHGASVDAQERQVVLLLPLCDRPAPQALHRSQGDTP